MTPITVSIRVVARTPSAAIVYRPTGGPLGGVDVPFVDPPTLPNIDPESVADGVAVGVTVAVDVAVAVAVGTTVAVDVGVGDGVDALPNTDRFAGGARGVVPFAPAVRAVLGTVALALSAGELPATW